MMSLQILVTDACVGADLAWLLSHTVFLYLRCDVFGVKSIIDFKKTRINKRVQ